MPQNNSMYIATFLTPLTMQTDAKTTLVFHYYSRTHEQQQTDIAGFIVWGFFVYLFGCFFSGCLGKTLQGTLFLLSKKAAVT